MMEIHFYPVLEVFKFTFFWEAINSLINQTMRDDFSAASQTALQRVML